jgi:hypothetical protein
MLMFEKMNNNQVAQVAHVAMYLLLPNVFAVLHWLAVRVYSNYCSPPGFMGLVTSWFLIGVSSVGLLNLLFKNSTSSAAAVSSAAAATAGTGTTD